jgi:V8-like Glu-specific endopeptidase
MAKNAPTGDNARKGAVKDRTQVQNPKTGLWTKRDSDNGKFMDVKTSSDKPFKGVTKEK